MKTTDNADHPTSIDQRESSRNLNFTMDIPKGKFRKALLFWNQNKELVLIYQWTIFNFKTELPKGNKVSGTAR